MNHPTQYRRRIFGICRRAVSSALALAIILVPAIIATIPAQAQTYTYSVLYSFMGGPDGENPWAGVVVDAQGNLYGTTTGGGSYGNGTVFKVDTAGTETVLHSFGNSPDGANPYYAGVVLDGQGNLYGTTFAGGAYGNGTVFKVDTTGSETVLYSFGNSPDGANPDAGVVLDGQGNLYGTTFAGGAYGNGTVFKVDTTGSETVLHSFGNSPDGANPDAGVVLDGQGNLYGTTEVGGSGFGGTAFKVDTSGNEIVLYSFCSQAHCYDGLYPRAGVVLDAQGNLYGTTSVGGDSGYKSGYGTVYKIDQSENETVLYAFTASAKHGAFPYAGVVLDAQGNLYGTTQKGGSGPNLGTVFTLDGAGNESLLQSFSGKTGGGAIPLAGLVLDAQGSLYGTTASGGAYEAGTVFRLLSPAAATTTTITSAPNPSTYGEAVTFTAVVSGGAGAPPDGETVTFINVKTVLGTGALSGGSATFTTSTLPVGAHPVKAVYGGDVHLFGSTSNWVKQAVKKAKK
jgi:uncharacterized repeat protein (TIGR03803 family)